MTERDKKVALTGGIGSGKSYVCALLRERGITVYDCDAGAKRVMREDVKLQHRLSEAVGHDIFPAGVMDKAALAAYMMQDDENVRKVNDIVHPAVADDFDRSGCQWLESAIYYDSGFDRRVAIDFVVCVTAPEEVRVTRVMQRDGISREKAMEWIRCQMSQAEKAARADFIIVNDGIVSLDEQLNHLLSELHIYK